MQILRRLVVPQRMDATILLCGLFAFLVSARFALFAEERTAVSALILGLSTAVWCAWGAAAGLKQISWQRAAVLTTASILSSVAAVLTSTHDLTLFAAHAALPINPLQYYRRVTWILPFIPLVAWVALALMRLAMDRWSPGLAFSARLPQSRLRLLISLALLMFAVQKAIEFSNLENNPITIAAYIVLPIVFLYWLSETLTGSFSWLAISLCLGLNFLTIVVLVMTKPNLILVAVFTAALILGLLGVGSGLSRKPLSPTGTFTCQSMNHRPMGISVWGFLPLIISLGLVALPWYLHLPTLFVDWNRSQFWERVGVAKDISSFTKQTDSKFVYSSLDSMRFEFDFKEYSDANSLLKADAIHKDGQNRFPAWIPYLLKNLHRKVETRMGNFRIFTLMVEEGNITTQQLQDLGDIVSSIFQVRNVNVEPGPPATLSLRHVYLFEMSDQQVVSFLQAVAPESSINSISIHSGVSRNSWPEIARKSLTTYVHCADDDGWQDIQSFPKTASKKLLVRFPGDLPLRHLLQSPAFCDSNILFTGTTKQRDIQPLDSILEVKLLLRGLSTPFLENLLEPYASVANWAHDDLLVFERNKSGAPQGLLCPFPIHLGTFPTAGLEELRTLTLDLAWVDPYYPGVPHRQLVRFNPQFFLDMPKLERLVFPGEFQFEHLDFLEVLSNLKRLQIDLLNTKSDQFTTFAKLTGLEELTLLSEPGDDLLIELAKLKQLKKITVVVPEAGCDLTTVEESIKGFLPTVQMSVVSETVFQPDVPESCKRHFDQVRRGLKAKIASSFDSFHREDSNKAAEIPGETSER